MTVLTDDERPFVLYADTHARGAQHESAGERTTHDASVAGDDLGCHTAVETWRAVAFAPTARNQRTTLARTCALIVAATGGPRPRGRALGDRAR